MFPESVFVVPVQRLEKGPEFYTGSEISEFGEKTLCRPGSYFGETTGVNPGLTVKRKTIFLQSKNCFGRCF